VNEIRVFLYKEVVFVRVCGAEPRLELLRDGRWRRHDARLCFGALWPLAGVT
jgi:hypothetical protein